jgi:hypothetical protein
VRPYVCWWAPFMSQVLARPTTRIGTLDGNCCLRRVWIDRGGNAHGVRMVKAVRTHRCDARIAHRTGTPRSDPPNFRSRLVPHQASDR